MENEKNIPEETITAHCVKLSEISILTKSLAFTEAPLSQSSFTLEGHPAMTVERQSKNSCDHFTPFSTETHTDINSAQTGASNWLDVQKKHEQVKSNITSSLSYTIVV